MVNYSKQKETTIKNDYIIRQLREDNNNLFEDSHQMRVLFFKTLTQIENFENEEIKRENEINV